MINFSQLYLIEQNPQFPQEHMNPNFKKFNKSWNFWNQSIEIMWTTCIHKNPPLTISNQNTKNHQKPQILLSSKFLKKMTD